MQDKNDANLKAQLTIDDNGRVRQITYLEQPWESSQESPLSAAIEYLRQLTGVLSMSASEMQNPQQKVTFTEPRRQEIEYRLGGQKQIFDSSTFIFNQTYLNVPVWRAAITLTVKHNPNRVVSVSDTSEHGVTASLPTLAKIEEHRRLFALAAVEQRVRAFGLGDEAPAVSLGEDTAQTETAIFIRKMLGRNQDSSGEDAPRDNAKAIRGRFYVYRYLESQRTPERPENTTAPETPETGSISGVENVAIKSPVLSLPPVDPSIADGEWRFVSEVTFALRTPEYGVLNWRALVDVETNSVLLLEALVSDEFGMVFVRDPITSTGDVGITPNQNNNVLNPLRQTIELPNLDAPINGVQSLRGRFAVIANIESPSINPPTSTNSGFNFDVRTNDFAAVNAYYHTDRFFSLIESLGFPIPIFFSHTRFPVSIDHRGLGNDINAHCVGDGEGGIDHACYGLNDTNTANGAIGRACDSRVHFHELGGHGILYEHVASPNFRFAHSLGDAFSAILHDPNSKLRDDPVARFRYAPWNPLNDRRFDRAVAEGWGWGGAKYNPFTGIDPAGYQAEQILSTTLFRIYRSIGGDSADLGQRRFASRMMMYLMLRAVSTLTPATNPRNPLDFANALMAVDLLNWTSEGVFGGAYNKVIRWSFEKQGLYQLPGAPVPVVGQGAPPEVDVYIDDGRRGEYQYQPEYWNNPSVWNRRVADGGAQHQEPIAGLANYAYVRIKNRGVTIAQNVRVRGYHHKPGGTTVWPDDFQPLSTTELVVGTLAPNNAEEKVIGPFSWIPSADALEHDSLLMVVSADGDVSNINHITAGEMIPEWRLIPNDNNLGLRGVVPGAASDVPPLAAETASEQTSGINIVNITEQLLQQLGLPGKQPKRARIKNLTLQIEFDDETVLVREPQARTMMASSPASAGAAGNAEWGMRRHAIIATAAMDRIQSANALTEIRRIFEESDEVSLGEAARWADRLKQRDRPRDPATERFLGDLRNRNHSRWHYVNLPLDISGYDLQQHPEFTRSDDIVQMILLCVESLRSPGPRARFEEIIALRWLAHLIGDLHQPVHIGCGYILNEQTSQARLVRQPNEAIGLPSDRGGGALRLPNGGNLHGFWDSQLGPDLVQDAPNALSDEALVRALSVSSTVPSPAAQLNIQDRVISWANASLAAARNAYQGLVITGYNPTSSGVDYPVSWEGEASYRQRCAPIVSERMSAAASNLAALLDAIWP